METSAGCRQAQAPPIKLSLLLTIKAFLRGQNLSGELNPFSVFSSKKTDLFFASRMLLLRHISRSSHPEQPGVIRRSKDCIRNAGSLMLFSRLRRKGVGCLAGTGRRRKEGRGGFGNILCPRPAVRHTTGETTRAPRWKRRKTWMA